MESQIDKMMLLTQLGHLYESKASALIDGEVDDVIWHQPSTLSSEVAQHRDAAIRYLSQALAMSASLPPYPSLMSDILVSLAGLCGPNDPRSLPLLLFSHSLSLYYQSVSMLTSQIRKFRVDALKHSSPSSSSASPSPTATVNASNAATMFDDKTEDDGDGAEFTHHEHVQQLEHYEVSFLPAACSPHPQTRRHRLIGLSQRLYRLCIAETHDAASTSKNESQNQSAEEMARLLQGLPKKFTLCTLSLSRSERSLFVTRLNSGHSIVEQHTLFEEATRSRNQQGEGRVETDTNCLSFPQLHERFQSIISNITSQLKASAKAASSAASTTMEANARKGAWWERRRKLDEELQLFLGQLQRSLLGGLQVVLQTEFADSTLEDEFCRHRQGCFEAARQRFPDWQPNDAEETRFGLLFRGFPDLTEDEFSAILPRFIPSLFIERIDRKASEEDERNALYSLLRDHYSDFIVHVAPFVPLPPSSESEAFTTLMERIENSDVELEREEMLVWLQSQTRCPLILILGNSIHQFPFECAFSLSFADIAHFSHAQSAQSSSDTNAIVSVCEGKARDQRVHETDQPAEFILCDQS